ncbi:ribonuclease P protein component [Patescibacteria group bacterium]|nr:ribonuclease P protein component [Patescibacteria group bacterium]
MFSRRERLPRALFPAVLKTGRRLSSPHFMAVVSKEAKGYAVVLSKKTARLSVTRHRIKRRVLAALRTLPLPPAVIVFPKASASSVSYEDIHTEIKKLLS